MAELKIEGLTSEQADLITSSMAVANAAVAYFKAMDALERLGPAPGRTEAAGATYRTLRAATDRYDDVSETWRVVQQASPVFDAHQKEYRPK